MLYKNTKQVLAALHQISRLTMTGMSREELARSILEAVAEALVYDRVALYLLREGSDVLEGVINVGCQVSVKGLKYDVNKDDCVETRVVRTGEIVRIREGLEQSFLTPLDKRRNAALKRSVCVLMPVLTERGIVGTMLADRSYRHEEISDDDIEILEIFCNQIGLVVENRRLNASNRRQIEELIELQLISRQMSEISDMEKLQNLIVSRGVKLGAAQIGWLLRRRGPGEKLRPVAAYGAAAEEFWSLEIKAQLKESSTSGQTLFRAVRRVASATGGRQVGVLSLPLLLGKREQGILVLQYREVAAPAELNIDLLKVFATQADKAMESLIFNQTLIRDRDFRDSILRSSPNAIITLDSSLFITSHNRSAEKVFASLNPDWRGSIFALLDSPVLRQALTRVGNREQALAQLEMNQVFPAAGGGQTAGGEKIFFVSVTALGGMPKTDGGLLVLVQDQTEKRKSDQELERMRRLASIGQLAAGIAHEIRNPLTGMNISLDIIRNELTDHPYAARLLCGVVEELDRLESIVSSMLEFSRTGILERSWVDLAVLLRDWLEMFQEQARRQQVEVLLRLPENSLPPVYGDREKLKQVLLNLALNALAAAREGGGEVVLSLGLQPFAGGHDFASDLEVCEDRPWLWLRVMDNGPGMGRELLEKIYDPFFTTKNRGTGLGLSIAHSIVKEHGGRLVVESEPGRGSTFAVGLPAGEAQPRYQRVEDVQSNTYN
ncbi:MAG TPA: GAF domain-containing protein [Proteobacteria bacterium]|nr:GAF domain-containing protein [Pseudomonadota bacterium]